VVEEWEALAEELEEVKILLELALEEDDSEAIGEVDERLTGLRKKLRGFELQWMLGKEGESRNAIVSINSGAGGTEAQDWAEMLLRLYL